MVVRETLSEDLVERLIVDILEITEGLMGASFVCLRLAPSSLLLPLFPIILSRVLWLMWDDR